MVDDTRGTVEIMAMDRAVLLPSSNSSKLFVVRSVNFSCLGLQLHAANKYKTDKSSLDFLAASGHLNEQIGRRRSSFQHSATSHYVEHSFLS